MVQRKQTFHLAQMFCFSRVGPLSLNLIDQRKRAHLLFAVLSATPSPPIPENASPVMGSTSPSATAHPLSCATGGPKWGGGEHVSRWRERGFGGRDGKRGRM